MSFEEAEDVAPARSPRSTRSTDRPRPAASRAMPTPLIPPPTTNKSTGEAPQAEAPSLATDISGNCGNLPFEEHGHGIIAQLARSGIQHDFASVLCEVGTPQFIGAVGSCRVQQE